MRTSLFRDPLERAIEGLPPDLRRWVRAFQRAQPHVEVVAFRGREILVKRRVADGYGMFVVSGKPERPLYREI